MKTKIINVVLFITWFCWGFGPSQAMAQEKFDKLELTNGTVYENVTVTGSNPDGLRITHSKGVAKAPFALLSEDIQKKSAYDKEKAEAFIAAEKERNDKAWEQKWGKKEEPKVESPAAAARTVEKPKTALEEYHDRTLVARTKTRLQALPTGFHNPNGVGLIYEPEASDPLWQLEYDAAKVLNVHIGKQRRMDAHSLMSGKEGYSYANGRWSPENPFESRRWQETQETRKLRQQWLEMQGKQ